MITARYASRLSALPVALLVLVGGCQIKDRETSAAPEAPIVVVREAGLAARPTAPHVSTYPNGGALVVDPIACTAARLHETVRWIRSLAPCDQNIEGAVALDSTAVVRTPSTLIGFDPEGNELWKVALAQPFPAPPLTAPTVTRDSMAVIALSSQLVIAYRKGQEAWRFALPASDALVAAPVGSQTEGVLLASSRGFRALGADGALRWTSPTSRAAGN